MLKRNHMNRKSYMINNWRIVSAIKPNNYIFWKKIAPTNPGPESATAYVYLINRTKNL